MGGVKSNLPIGTASTGIIASTVHDHLLVAAGLPFAYIGGRNFVNSKANLRATNRQIKTNR